ncbi:uncharacterized protein LOC143039988 [Oratosquilla oratoria]|uniref:uncharacterized protein LOC143039988 n=1 Tax=Oratosquilla oratoria TaxID=337810 RepID=UPI003F75C78E
MGQVMSRSPIVQEAPLLPPPPPPPPQQQQPPPPPPPPPPPHPQQPVCAVATTPYRHLRPQPPQPPYGRLAATPSKASMQPHQPQPAPPPPPPPLGLALDEMDPRHGRPGGSHHFHHYHHHHLHHHHHLLAAAAAAPPAATVPIPAAAVTSTGVCGICGDEPNEAGHSHAREVHPPPPPTSAAAVVAAAAAAIAPPQPGSASSSPRSGREMLHGPARTGCLCGASQYGNVTLPPVGAGLYGTTTTTAAAAAASSSSSSLVAAGAAATTSTSTPVSSSDAMNEYLEGAGGETAGGSSTSTGVVVTPPRSVLLSPPQDVAPSLAPPSAGCGRGCRSCGNAGSSSAAAAPTAPTAGHCGASCQVSVHVEVECLAHNASSSSSSSSSSGPAGVGGVDQRQPRRALRTISFPKRHKQKGKSSSKDLASKKKKNPWTLRLNCKFRTSKAENEGAESGAVGCGACVCTGYRRGEETLPRERRSSGPEANSVPSTAAACSSVMAGSGPAALKAPVIDLSKFNPDIYPIEDCEEWARQERAREMAEGVEPPPGFTPQPLPLAYNSVLDLHLLLETSLWLVQQPGGSGSVPGAAAAAAAVANGGGAALGGSSLAAGSSAAPTITEETLIHQFGRLAADGSLLQRTVHTQVDYIHCLVPDLLDITRCGFYWGKMDRYEAERLLDNRPEGTFLLRDSAQEEYLFSVSFRRYGRSLHARIEQWNHKFSFDSHDPGVFASDKVCGLIEHYKDPSCCMFFEPMLTNPLHRTFPFPLQHLCRAVICSATTYDGINHLRLPKALKNYLKEYHYKQRVRVRRLDH